MAKEHIPDGLVVIIEALGSRTDRVGGPAVTRADLDAASKILGVEFPEELSYFLLHRGETWLDNRRYLGLHGARDVVHATLSDGARKGMDPRFVRIADDGGDHDLYIDCGADEDVRGAVQCAERLGRGDSVRGFIGGVARPGPGGSHRGRRGYGSGSTRTEIAHVRAR